MKTQVSKQNLAALSCCVVAARWSDAVPRAAVWEFVPKHLELFVGVLCVFFPLNSVEVMLVLRQPGRPPAANSMCAPSTNGTRAKEDCTTVSAASLMPVFESHFFLSMLQIVELVAGLAAESPDQLSSGSLSDTSG